MGNRLFREAREAVAMAKEDGSQASIERAENALSSAFANTNFAEKEQLHQYQDELDRIKGN